MSVPLPGGGNPEYPALQAGHWVGQIGSLTGGTTLFNHASFPFSDMFLDGIDLVDATYTNGHNCSVQVNSSFIVGGGVVIFQGFTYTSSQGAFSWRGHLWLQSDATITADAVVGTWQVSAWGSQYPAIGL